MAPYFSFCGNAHHHHQTITNSIREGFGKYHWWEDFMIFANYNYLITIITIISEVTRTYRFHSNFICNLISEFHCYKYLFLLLSSRNFLFYKRKHYPWVMIAQCHRTAKRFFSHHRDAQRIAHKHSTG